MLLIVVVFVAKMLSLINNVITPWSIKTYHFCFLNTSVSILTIFGVHQQETPRKKTVVLATSL